MKDKGFIFDYAKCVGCHACMVACFNENKTTPPLSWRSVNAFNSKKIPLSGFLYLSLACNHCKEAPCLKACPANAYSRDTNTGAVIHNPNRCIGCQYCTWVCPYDAPKFNPKTRIIEKCNFCNHLLSEDKIPACANNCPTGALAFGDIVVSENIESAGMSSKKIFPRINTKRSEISESIPEMDLELNALFDNNKILKLKTQSKINAIHEWPLILFTLIASILSGWFASSNLNSNSFISLVLFISLGAFGIILSTFHLGKPYRAIYSLINFKSSWLSREILFFTFFFIGSVVYLLLLKHEALFYISLISSIIMLVSIDLVYISFDKNNLIFHSAGSILTFLLFTFLFGNQLNFILAFLSIKTLFYLVRKRDLIFSKNSSFLSLLRVLIGFFLPFSIMITYRPIEYTIPLIIIGELIDRYEFYDSLQVETPQNNLIKDLIYKKR